MPLTSAERVRAYRERQKNAGLADSSRANKREHQLAYRRRSASERPFVGCDGEGAGTDEKGRQLYCLFRMGDRELYTGNQLATQELLDFICDAPSDVILVGFAFGYDVTMILRDLPEKQARKLFEPVALEKGHSRYVWFRDFDLEYLPKNYFRVKRVKIVHQPDGSERRVPIKGSQRTIYETFGFFQKSFLKSIESFDVGTPEQRASIAEQKARRSEFVSIDQTERDYCALECRFLAELMEKLRQYCYAANIVPRTWNGAGKLASALHAQHHTIKREQVVSTLPQGVADFANMAYYGGRFEITRTGQISQPVYEYDIRSAYPDAMRKLPCLEHGSWRYTDDAKDLQVAALCVASVTFRQSRVAAGYGQLGGLPVRSKEGHLIWPRQASGIYWNVEIAAAEKLGVKVRYKEGWIYERHCDCRAFDWVEPLYDYRASIGSQGPGYPIKLGINSLYGKLAQRKGNGVYHNMVWAGLITAFTRAKLMGAIEHAPSQIVMVATDAVYSLVPLPLPTGEKLGEWEMAELADLFIVQPGLYWSPDKRKKKSRGLSGSFFEQSERTESFERAFHYWASQDQNGISDGSFPSVVVPVPGFIGLKLALSRNKHDLAGTWINDKRAISFDYRNKRELHEWRDGHIITAIKPGSPNLVSLPHRDFLKAGGQEAWEAAREVLDEQPDWVDLGAPFQGD